MAVRERAREKKAFFLCDSTTTVYYCTVCVERGKKLIKDTRERERMAQPRYRMDEDLPTHTSRVQEECARACEERLEAAADSPAARRAGVCDEFGRVRLLRNLHARYCRRGLDGLSRYMSALDASRPWLCYWIVHSLALLDALPDESEDPILTARVVDTLKRMQRIDGTLLGGFGGGPGQLPHCAQRMPRPWLWSLWARGRSSHNRSKAPVPVPSQHADT